MDNSNQYIYIYIIDIIIIIILGIMLLVLIILNHIVIIERLIVIKASSRQTSFGCSPYSVNSTINLYR